jgi:uncharacterized phage protein (TIGR02218 family)
MSLAAIANLITGARPFYLYLFRRGVAEYRFTSIRDNLTRTVPGVASTLWTSMVISHSKISDSDQAFRSELNITVPLSSEFADSLVGTFDFDPVLVTIYKGDLNSAEIVPIFKGRVLTAQPDEGGTCQLVCMTEIAALQRKGLAAVIQRPCRHVHYGAKCGLDFDTLKVATEVLAISESGTVLELLDSDTQPDGYYRLGILQWGNRLEMMLAHTGNTVSLVSAILGLVEAVALGTVPIFIAPGCSLSRSSCNDKFNNILNFGGFPFIADNPFDGRQVF